ncbi:MAG: ABC transporter ATP-binding protein [Ignavibacteria bacterium]|nr:ABC transporter ATP-binding protein [Ignavibacteria bacterium]
MSDYSIQALSLTKSFGRRLIFKEINFVWEMKGIFGISGPNGSGKSTLVKIIAGLLSPTKGKIIHKNSDKEIIPEKLHDHIGFVSPYLVLYEEFSAWENLEIFAHIRGIELDKDRVKKLLEEFLIYNRRDDLVKTYSSGMKQRLKFVFALMHIPEVLIFDEPTSNLDEDGKKVVHDIIRNAGKERIVIIASNENNDLEFCDDILYLEKYKI